MEGGGLLRLGRGASRWAGRGGWVGFGLISWGMHGQVMADEEPVSKYSTDGGMCEFSQGHSKKETPIALST